MDTIRKMRWMLIAILLCFVTQEAIAANRTIKVAVTDGGQFRYRVSTNGSTWGSWKPSDSTYYDVTKTETIPDNGKIQVEAAPKTGTGNADIGHTFLCWTNSGWENVSTATNQIFTVNGSDQTYTARFIRCWRGTLPAGTYTLTAATGGFNVNGGSDVYKAIGDILVNSGNVNIRFNSSTVIYINGEITVNGGKLTMQKMSADDGSTLKRYNFIHGNASAGTRIVLHEYKGRCIHVKNTTSNNPNNCELVFKGYRSGSTVSNFTLSGGCDGLGFGTDSSGDPYPNPDNNPNQDSRIKAETPLLEIAGGKVTVDDVTFTHNWTETLGTSNLSNGGAFKVITGTRSESVVVMNNCTIKNCVSYSSGGAFYVSTSLVGDNRIGSIKMNNCTIQNCFSKSEEQDSGGTIRTIGSSFCTLEMNNCTVKNNYSVGNGGGISWNAGRVDALELDGCSFTGNWTANYGGGLSLASLAHINNCTIKNNTAKQKGGGINYSTWSSRNWVEDFRPYDGDLVLDANTVIEYNTAGQQGGGLYIGISPIVVGHGDPNHDPYTVYTNINGGTYSVNLNVNGAKIRNNTSASHGGGVFMTRSTDIYITDINLNYGEIKNNHATNYGGGLAVFGGIPVKVGSTSGTLNIMDNYAQRGGGIYLSDGNITINNGNIGLEGHPNTSNGGNGGGVFVSNGNLIMSGGSVAYNHAIRSDEGAGGNGGAFCVTNGDVTITGGNLSNNIADASGGCVYATNGNFGLNNCTIDSNEATNGFGGGLYLSNGNMTVSGTTTAIKSNHSYNKGGGIYVGGGTFTMTGGTIGGTTAEGNYTTSEGSSGGGLYMGGGTADISGGTISGNTSEYGGAVYSANGAITVTGGTIGNNEAQYGGGIYAQQGFVEFSDGYIHHNHASKRGGGIYVDQLDTLYLKGSASLAYNNVPTDSVGGGVYLKGTIIVGEPGATGSIMAQTNYAGDHYTYTWENTGHPETDSIDHILTNNRNNIYLPNPEVRPDHTDVITIVENGISATSRVGFSVPHGNVPVIYCKNSPTSQDYLHQFSTGQANQYNLFDDTRRYVAVQYSNQPGLFDPDHVYLYGFWSNEVTGDASEDYCVVDTAMFRLNDTIPISTPCELAFFITWVNGLNSVAPHPTANAKLMADIDMSEFGWVPIGKSDAGYSGVFDGNGHTVTGLVGLLYREYTDYGFFGKLTDSAEVKNLFVRGANFYLEENGHPLNVGGLAGEIEGTTIISNSEVSSSLYVENTGSVIGGLVGRQNAGMIHSCIAISDMTGNTMGGLVGVIESGKLYNSYANPDFSYLTPNVYYIGGLVAENSGTIQNCYVRPRDPSVNSNTKLGLLIGWNKTGGNTKYCYSTEKVNGQQQYVVTVQGTCHYRSYTIDDIETPYQYLRRDNQVTVRVGDRTYIPDHYSTDTLHNPACTEPDLQMLLCLNNWVTAKNNETGTHPIYSSWQRPTTMIINDDLPVLMMPGDYAEAIAATDGDPFLYYSSVNNLIGTYTSSSQAIWLYKSKQDLASNDGSAAKLYIAEHDIEGKPLTVIPNGTVHAYVGVTLDNSAGLLGSNPTYGDAADYTDWHMFSTTLTDAPLGVYYTDTTQWPSGDFSFPGHPTDMPYYHFYDNEEAATGANDWERRGYFPSHVYKTDYDGTATEWETTGGNYYRHWDYYTYYEPEYHWINFKRNDNSHWHEKAPDIPIYYDGDEEDGRMGNEHYLVKGRGYLLATREDNTFLQCHGTLNTDEVRIRVTRDGAYNPGYNFLGNPYLTYLDFDEFARVNGETLWGDSVPQGGTWSTDISNAAYAIIDEDPIPGEPDSVAYMRGGYKYYTPNATIGKYSAPRYIAPHQGFMILATQAGVAKFNTGMRSFAGDGGHFRGDEHPAYALVNLLAIDGNGNRDITTVELGRPDKGGAPLMRELKLATCHVYSRYEGKDWAIAFTQPGVTEVAIRFEAYQDGEYTLRWDTENGEFHYLHLIDNLTGTDIDCLTASEYRFTSTTMDYKSRFRLVFGYTGIEEPEIEEPVQGNFAYQSGDALVVTGEGTVELFDVMGRKLNTQRIEGVQGTMSVSGLTPGVYLLRLATTKGIRVQKIVINQ